MKMKPEFLFFILLQICKCSLTEALTYTIQPSFASGIEGQSVTITWNANLGAGETWDNVRVAQEVAGLAGRQRMIRFSKTTGRLVYSAYTNRNEDLNLTASLSGTLLTAVFTMKNLNRSTDEHLYSLRITYTDNLGDSDSRESADLQLTVLVPPTIASPDPSPGSVTVNETQTTELECTATGNPAPSYNWTRDGVIVGTGSPFTTPAVTFNDDNACYTCIAFNDLDAKTANVCLNVQYKPRSTLSLVSAKSTVCQNDAVSLTCTSGPANPAPSSYEFYDNGVLVGTSVSNVYEATAGIGLPAVNKLVCVPRNLLGAAMKNASVEMSAKVAPRINTSSQASTIVVEGRALTLFCNASGVPAPNITWSKVGGSIVGNSETYTISSVTRGDEGTYRCTASNGDECSNVTAEAAVVVNYKPENTNLTHNKSNDVFLIGEPVLLTCESQAKPSDCCVLFYHGSQLLANKSSSTCTASHVISSIEGCNDERFSCFAMNEVGTGDRAYKNVAVQVPPGASVVPSSDNIVKVEGEALTLSCTPSGCPTPTVIWIKTGVSSPLEQGSGGVLNKTFASLSKQDTGIYYCNVNNGVVGSPAIKTIYLNVTYKPYLTNLTSTLSNTCLNDPVTLQCTTDANPPVYEYHFYLNDVLVHTSMSGVYQVKVPQAGNNEYKCEPVNTVGAGQNGTVILTKDPYGVIGSSHPTSNTGISSTAFIAVIVVAVVIILLLILVVIWMRFKDRQKNRRTKSKDQNKTEVQLQTFEADYDNKGFVFRHTQADGDMVLYEQVQNRDQARNQGVDSAPSIPMGYMTEIDFEQFEREARAAAIDNQEPSYQNPYQELQLENRFDRDYQSLQNL